MSACRILDLRSGAKYTQRPSLSSTSLREYPSKNAFAATIAFSLSSCFSKRYSPALDFSATSFSNATQNDSRVTPSNHSSTFLSANAFRPTTEEFALRCSRRPSAISLRSIAPFTCCRRLLSPSPPPAPTRTSGRTSRRSGSWRCGRVCSPRRCCRRSR